MVKPIKQIRRENMLHLASRFRHRSDFADHIEKRPAYLNQIIGPNPSKGIGDMLARHVELVFDLPKGWMDTDHSMVGASTNTELKRMRKILVMLTYMRDPIRLALTRFRCHFFQR